MKLRARFPQIGQAPAPSPAPSARGALRRAFFPTTDSGAGLLPAAPVAAPPTEPSSMPAAIQSPVFSHPQAGDWASTVAAWRSTTGLNGERP